MYIRSIDCFLHPLVLSSYHIEQNHAYFYRLIGHGLLVQDDTERRAIVAKVMEQKEIIKKASQEIVKKIDDPITKHCIDTKVLEILTAISNIGTITDNSERFTNFIGAWKNQIDLALTQEQRQLRILLARQALYTICSISFIVKKQRGKYTINLPKIDLSLFKIGC